MILFPRCVDQIGAGTAGVRNLFARNIRPLQLCPKSPRLVSARSCASLVAVVVTARFGQHSAGIFGVQAFAPLRKESNPASSGQYSSRPRQWTHKAHVDLTTGARSSSLKQCAEVGVNWHSWNTIKARIHRLIAPSWPAHLGARMTAQTVGSQLSDTK